MASPGGVNGNFTPPPPSSAASRPPPASQSQLTTQNNIGAGVGTNSPSTLHNTPGESSQASALNKPASAPRLSTQDSGTSKRPRDARLLHLWLGQMGVHAYEERVPLQLMDFAYRYTTGVLTDAVALGDTAPSGGAGRGGGGAGQADGQVSLHGVKQAIASRVGFQFNPVLSKEWLKELAEERNKVNLPKAEREFGIRLPPERYCLMGTGWGLKEEWESEEDFADADEDQPMEDGEGEKVADVNMEENEEDEFEDAMGVDNRMEG